MALWGVQDHSKECFRRTQLSAVVHGDLTSEQITLLGEKVDNRCPILSLLRSGGSVINSSWTKA